MYPNAAVAARHPVSWPAPWLKAAERVEKKALVTDHTESKTIMMFITLHSHSPPTASSEKIVFPFLGIFLLFRTEGIHDTTVSGTLWVRAVRVDVSSENRWPEKRLKATATSACVGVRVCVRRCLPRQQHHFNFWPHAKTTILNFGILWVFEFYAVRSGIIFGVEWSHWMLQLDAMWFWNSSFMCCCCRRCWGRSGLRLIDSTL